MFSRWNKLSGPMRRRPGLTQLVLFFWLKFSWKIVCNTMLYMIFQLGWDFVQIERISLGFESILENILSMVCFVNNLFLFQLPLPMSSLPNQVKVQVRNNYLSYFCDINYTWMEIPNVLTICDHRAIKTFNWNWTKEVEISNLVL